MQAHSRPTVKRVPHHERRKVFNEAKIWERTIAGEFDAVVLSRGAPSSPSEPPGTESQMISIRRKTDRAEVARVHAYIRPDNSIGGHGKPDPKIVLDESRNLLLMEERKKRA